MVFAEDAQMPAQVRSLVPPTAHADVDVVALREDPAVTAGYGCKLEQQRAAPVSRWELVVGEVALERNAVDDRAAQPERAGGHAVRPVGADQRADLDRLAVHAEVYVGFDLGSHTFAEGHSRLDRALDHEGVELSALRHHAEDVGRASLHHRSVAQPTAGAGDPVLDHGLDGERQLPDGARRQAAAAGLVPGETRLVY